MAMCAMTHIDVCYVCHDSYRCVTHIDVYRDVESPTQYSNSYLDTCVYLAAENPIHMIAMTMCAMTHTVCAMTHMMCAVT